MRKFNLFKIACISVFIVSVCCGLFAGGTSEFSTREQREQNTARTEDVRVSNEARALAQVPIPETKYFTERQTIARWYERWDKPSVVTYVYLISYGNILGYYVCNGKPASIQSYLVPESSPMDATPQSSSYNIVMGETLDIDGTYGTLNSGIRFFTSDGIAVEWGGEGATYLYSDAPLPLDVPRLNPEQ